MILLLFFAAAAFGQSAKFEVATVKPMAPMPYSDFTSGKAQIGMRVVGDRVEIHLSSLETLISMAYRVERYQVSGPDSMQPFEVMAKIPPGASKEQVPEMLQNLLAERFELKVHREKRTQPVYALVVAGGTPNLNRPLPSGPPLQEKFVSEYHAGDATISTTRDGTTYVYGGPGGDMTVTRKDGVTHTVFSSITMPLLAKALSPRLDLPVVDETKLPGYYSLAIDFTNEKASSALFASIQKLGLKLERRTSSVEQIVVDHVLKLPKPN